MQNFEKACPGPVLVREMVLLVNCRWFTCVTGRDATCAETAWINPHIIHAGHLNMHYFKVFDNSIMLCNGYLIETTEDKSKVSAGVAGARISL